MPAVADPHASIAAAHEAMTRGEVARALGLLVDAWRQVPDRVLAEAIEAIGPRAARKLGPPAGSDDDRAATWLAAAAIDDPMMRGPLLASVRDGRMEDRIPVLARHRDPRFASLVVKELLHGNHAGPWRVASHWVPLTKALVGCGDPRVVAHLPDILACWRAAAAGLDRTRMVAMHQRVAKLAERMAKAFPPAALAQLDALADEHARLAEIVALANRPDAGDADDAAIEAALLAAIYAAPADDGPRLVYADWLLERGDPRGELIALQLQPSPNRARVNSLYTTYRDRICGPLAPYIMRGELERGFIASCQLLVGRTPPPDPAWATVHTIDGMVPATDDCPMPILHTATSLSHAALVKLAELASPPPLERLGVDAGSWSHDLEAIAAFAMLRLPKLRRLEISGDETWIPIGPDRMPWPWRRFALRELAVPSGLAHIAAWHRELVTAGLDRLELVVPGYCGSTVVLTRDTLSVEFGWPFVLAEQLAAMMSAIDGIPGLASFEIRVRRDTWSLAQRSAIASVLARHPDLVVTIPGYEPPRRRTRKA